MSRPELAVSTFVAGVDQGLASVDAYAKDVNKIINSIENYHKNFDLALGKLSQFLGIDLVAINNILKMIKAGKFKFSLDNLLKAIMSKYPNLFALINKLDRLMQDKFKQNAKLYGRAKVNINGNYYKLKKRDIAMVEIMNKMVSDFTGGSYNNKIVDKSAEAGLATGMLANLASNYMPGAYTAMMLQMNDKDLIIEATASMMSDIVSSGNIMLLSEIANGGYAAEILKKYPNLIGDFILNLKLDPDTLSAMGSSSLAKQAKLAELFETLMEAFALFDPNWNKTQRDVNTILFLDLITPSAAYNFHVLAQAFNYRNTKVISPPNPIVNIDTDMPDYFEDEFFYPLVQSMGKKTVANELKRMLPTVPFTVNPGIANYTAVLPTGLGS